MIANDSRSPEKNHQPRASSMGSAMAILLVATIVFVVVNGPSSDASDRNSAESSFDASAFLSGVQRYNNSADFRRGEASAFMGGVELDFRDAEMQGSQATLDVTAIMGGINLRVPRTWTVINHVTPILGGVEDHTHHGDNEKKLFLEGTVVMGGLEIKN